MTVAGIFRHACWMDLEGIVSKAHRLALREWPDTSVARDRKIRILSGHDSKRI